MSEFENESLIYVVQYDGNVCCINPNSGDETASCEMLSNPSEIHIKKAVSYNNLLWGISSDNELYAYVRKNNTAISFREELYENQRWNPISGFCTALLPSDRHPFSNEEGTKVRYKNDTLPSDSWEWQEEWQLETAFENQAVKDGWTYAMDFPSTYYPQKGITSCVRRRKWTRCRDYIATNRWNKIAPLWEDLTETIVDIGVGGPLKSESNQELFSLWVVSSLGQVYIRSDVYSLNPEGSEWLPIEVIKDLKIRQVSITDNGIPFIITLHNPPQILYGKSTNRRGTCWDWKMPSGPQGTILQLSVGFNTLWAVTTDKKCWVLKGKLQKIIGQSSPPRFEWIEIPGKIKSISVAPFDKAVVALPDDENCFLYIRSGISDEENHGEDWKDVSDRISFSTKLCWVNAASTLRLENENESKVEQSKKKVPEKCLASTIQSCPSAPPPPPMPGMNCQPPPPPPPIPAELCNQSQSVVLTKPIVSKTTNDTEKKTQFSAPTAEDLLASRSNLKKRSQNHEKPTGNVKPQQSDKTCKKPAVMAKPTISKPKPIKGKPLIMKPQENILETKSEVSPENIEKIVETETTPPKTASRQNFLQEITLGVKLRDTSAMKQRSKSVKSEIEEALQQRAQYFGNSDSDSSEDEENNGNNSFSDDE